MPAYVIVDVDVTDAETYGAYRRRAQPTLEAHGARFLVRGGETIALEGDWQPKRLVILEFPDLESAKRWWSSPEYAPARELRERSARSRIVLADGVR